MNHCTNIHLSGESFANRLSVEMVLRFHSFLSEVSKRHPTGVKTAFCFQRVISEKMPYPMNNSIGSEGAYPFDY